MYEPIKRKLFKDKKTGETFIYLYRSQSDLDKMDEKAPRNISKKKKEEIMGEINKMWQNG